MADDEEDRDDMEHVAEVQEAVRNVIDSTLDGMVAAGIIDRNYSVENNDGMIILEVTPLKRLVRQGIVGRPVFISFDGDDVMMREEPDDPGAWRRDKRYLPGNVIPVLHRIAELDQFFNMWSMAEVAQEREILERLVPQALSILDEYGSGSPQ